ncbi:hypothetical protein BC827DRAFT_1246440 [Russula dissimulans]|nr:hypothetical protein BC827DRAFT_1246440 [Russula dissimulans]
MKFVRPPSLLFTFSPLFLCYHTTLLAADVRRLDMPTRHHSSSANCIYSASLTLHTRLSPQNDTIRLATSVDPV